MEWRSGVADEKSERRALEMQGAEQQTI